MSSPTLSTAIAAWKRLWRSADEDELNQKQTSKAKNKKTHKKQTFRRSKKETLKAYQQRTITGRNLDLQDVEEFGNIFTAKQEHILRIGLQNVANLSQDKRTSKSRQLVDYIVQKTFDVFLMTEIGLCWRKIENENQWYERILGKFRSSRSVFAHNVTDLQRSKPLQPGGVGMIATDEVAHRVTAQGKDPTGLGRWVWLKFQGKNGVRTRVLSVYRPCDSLGPDTVNQQQLRYLRTNKSNLEPRDALYADLFQEIQPWITAGDHIVIGMDANEDIRTGATADFFQALGMKEAILSRHHSQSPPATYNRNLQRQPIDGIWVTPGLRAVGAGYCAFGDGCPSDHRVLWVDILYEEALGFPAQPLKYPKVKKLNTKDPRLVIKYNREVKKLLVKTGLAQRLFELEAQSRVHGWNPQYEKDYNRIYALHQTLRKQVENNIRKLRMGRVEWSPKLQRYRTEIELWSMMFKKRRGLKISNKRIRRFAKKSGIQDVHKFTLPQVSDRLDQAFKDYKAAKKNAEVWRDDFMTTLAKARAEANDTHAEVELKKLRQVLNQKRTARNVKRMRRKLGQNATTQLYVTENNVRRLVTDKIGMERACCQENDRRFSQSESTPPMVLPLLADLEYLADTKAADEILAGTYTVPPGVDIYTAKMIAELRMPDVIRNNPSTAATVTTEDHSNGWRRQKENVSSDPDGLSFSHFKAGIEDDLIANFDATLRSLPYQHGFSPTEWQHLTDVEILKKAGVYDIEKMRTIILMNSEFNMNNKKMGRDMMRNAELHGTLAREQYGSRKNHRSIIAALNKRLTMDLLRLKRMSGALCSNDAKSCYDRIVHSIASIAMRRQGVPKNPIRSMFLTLQRSAHKIRTAYGVSQSSYGNDREPPLQTIGQGNGCGPASWAVISTPIINMMKTAGFGFSLLTAISLECVSFVCYAFVDDTDVVHSARDVNTPGSRVLEEMQAVVDHWEGGLRATGGALVPEKSYWYLIDFVWKHDHWKYATIADVPGDITIRTVDGHERTTLRRFEAHHAEETLGVFLAMDGNNKEEAKKLRQKSEEFADCIRTGFITKQEAWYALNATIMKTFEYPMEAITLNKKQWDFIMSPVMMATLPRAGIVRTFPRDMVYAPADYCGLGILHPYYRQQLTHLKTLLSETMTNSITGDLMKACFEELRLEVGMPGRSRDWRLPITKDILTNCWMKDLLVFLEKHQMDLEDTQPLLMGNTTSDKFLMESFILHGYRKKDLKILNTCRMYLRAIFLSDITSADGNQIEPWAWKGNSSSAHQRHLQWPRKPPKLPAAHWTLWQQALSTCFVMPHSTTRKIRVDLGRWTASALQRWHWYYSPSEERVYNTAGISCLVYSRLPRRSRRHGTQQFQRADSDTTWLLPLDAIPASIIRCSQHCVRITGIAIEPQCSEPAVAAPTTLDDALMQRQPNDHWSVDKFDCSDNGENLAQAIQQGTATAISDGSYQSGRGTSAFILRGNDCTKRLLGVNTVPGLEDTQSAYRSELAGVAGSLAILAATCRIHHITDGEATIGLDGEQALKTASGDWPLNAGQPDFDLLCDIRTKIESLPITLKWKWIEGHQDDNVKFEDLDPLSQDNVLADSLAKAHLNQLGHDYVPSTQRFGDEGWSVRFAGKKLARVDLHTLYSLLYTPTTEAYWMKKYQLSRQLIRSIDWAVCGEAYRQLRFPQQRHVSKQATGHMAVGKMMQIWSFQETAECPRCQAPTERASHVLTCRDPRADAVWKMALTKLERWMTSQRTMPQLQTAILNGLSQWRDPTHLPCPSGIQDIRTAVALQDTIGWYPFATGHMGYLWKGIQQQYYAFLGRRNTGKKWARELIKKLWGVAWDMWEHRNDILHNSDTPAKLRRIAQANLRIEEEFDTGIEGLLPRDKHWILQPMVQVLRYDLIVKAQWLESVALARERFKIRRDASHEIMRNQRELMAQWLLGGTSAVTGET